MNYDPRWEGRRRDPRLGPVRENFVWTPSELRERLRDRRIRVGFDPHYDLNAAGYDATEAELESFGRALIRNLKRVAKKLGLKDVEGFLTSYGSAHDQERSTHSEEDEDGTPPETVLWQMAHDLTSVPARAVARQSRRLGLHRRSHR